MKIKAHHWAFTSLYYPLFWTVLCILSSSFAEDASIVPQTTSLFQNLSTNYTNEDKIETNHSGSVNVNSNELKPSEIVQSSFEEPPQNVESSFTTQPDYPFPEVVSQNAGISNEIGDGGQGVVLTFVDTATADLQQRADLSSSSQKEEETFLNKTTPPTEKEVKEEGGGGGSKNDTVVGVENVEDVQQIEKPPTLDVPKQEPKENLTEEIPSFSEWTQKQLQEAEKKREEVNASVQNQNWNGKANNNIKVRSKNYASPDCGAKIVAANPEAVSPSSVLTSSRDEYKLNTCTSRIWFIVELCEAIQAQKIDLANFELFSSSPQEFSISVSDRFPSREWSNVGHFTAKDERDIQSFDLSPHLFGKYIKFEMHSHHGSEHFCPISLFRVYGTSEFEVLEKEDQQHTSGQEDDDDDETLDAEKGQSAKNLFSSATDAVISIVKKAAEVLGNKGNISNQTNETDSKYKVQYTPLISTCTTPSHIVVCDNCSDILFGKVFELLSCRTKQLNNLLAIKLIRGTIYNTDVCLQFGLDFQSRRNVEMPNIYSSYVKSFFPPRYLAALCNTVAIIENKVVLNISKQVNVTVKDVNDVKLEQPVEPEVLTEATPLNNEETEQTNVVNTKKIEMSVINKEPINDTSYVSQINPDERIEITHTYNPQEMPETETIKVTSTTTIVNQTKDDIALEVGSIEPNNTEFETTPESTEELENLIQDLTIDQPPTASNSATHSPPQIKESVFLRLSNRIKTLERNMSLSSQYLEELSRRYKKQVEEMQRLLDKTITTLHEESKRKDERNDKLEERITQLTEIVEALIAEKNNNFNPLHLISLIIVSTITIFIFCRRNDNKQYAPISSTETHQRRKSIDVINHNTPAKKERRPSEEALKISGTYEHLLVDDFDSRKKSKDRKRKRKKNLQRSNSITTLTEENHSGGARSTWSDVNFKPMVTSSRIWNRQESAPSNAPTNWDSGVIKTEIEEIPFVLEESDINPLQGGLPLPKPLQEQVSNDNVHKTVVEIKVPFRKISSPAFLKATETRKSIRKLSPNGFLHKSAVAGPAGHKKSNSVDETKRQVSPTPSSSDGASVNLDEAKPNHVQKKEKKGTFKKILKKVF